MTAPVAGQAYQLDFLPWFSAPEAARAAFAAVDDWRRINVDRDTALVEFTWPCAITGGEGRVRLVYRRVGEELALTDIRFTQTLKDGEAAAAYIAALSDRYEAIDARGELGMSGRTLTKTRSALDEENMNEGAYHLSTRVIEAQRFPAPDGVEYGAHMLVTVDPVRDLGEYLGGEGEYYASYRYVLMPMDDTHTAGLYEY